MAKEAAKQKSVLLFIGGALALYFLSRRTASQSPSSEGSFENSVLDFTTGLIDTVDNLLSPKEETFVKNMQEAAQAVKAAFGIDPLITMTQAALESGWGTSGLTKKANNLYGFTGDSALNNWLVQKGLPVTLGMDEILKMDTSAAPFILMQTHEEAPKHSLYFTRPNDIVSQTQKADGAYSLMVWRPFRRYDSWASSAMDWGNLMRQNRYRQALADAQAGDLVSFANNVASAGYATESDYAEQLLAVGTTLGQIQSA